MKRALIISGIAGLGLLMPTGAMAGSLGNNFGASSSEFTGTSTGTSNIGVVSAISINNEVNIQSHTESASLDLNGNNGRLMTRETGAAHYNESSGMASGTGDFSRSGEYNSATSHSGEGEVNVAASGSQESSTSGDGSGAAASLGNPFAGLGFGAGQGEFETAEGGSGEVDVVASGSVSSDESSNRDSSHSADATAQGSFSTQDMGWAGQQNETAVDGQISGSIQVGTTDIDGTIRESGLTTTTVDITSITTGTSFGSEAKSFRNASF